MPFAFFDKPDRRPHALRHDGAPQDKEDQAGKEFTPLDFTS